MDELPKCPANYVPLSPVTFLERAAAVSVLAPNVPAMYEMHFAVPMAGAVLNTINTRLDAKTVATILRHAEAKLFFVDWQYIRLARDALKLLLLSEPRQQQQLPLVAVIDDAETATGVRLGELEYEEMVARGDAGAEPQRVGDEWDAIALNYTSGTTSAPKGVVYSHRGAYLSTLSLLLQWGVGPAPVYLWTLPMFHCNGWTFPWGVAARGGTNVCLRSASAAGIFAAIADHGVTHMCCAPVLFRILLEGPVPEAQQQLRRGVEVLTGGAPPPAALLERVERMGFRVTHAYGLTEATGPALACEWRAEWDRLPAAERAALKARQGVSVLSLADADVKNTKTMRSVPRDGRSVGEIVLRGSSIMKGYLKNPAANAEAFREGAGWFFTGDVGVVHPDGYVEIRDRSKDVIISGGENISSVEVEAVLYSHPAVAEAAVVTMPHPLWGETPCAFIVPREGPNSANEEDVVAHCRANMPHFMVPKKVVFVDGLPKTATGKIQKNELRKVAKNLKVTAPAPAPALERSSQQQQQQQQQQQKHSQKKSTTTTRHGQTEQQILAISKL
ncbi:Butyrate--CoA ligase AAE11, peroxisomal [Ananas comosus]|uniref:4-coumarate--CoA ligase n=1 Tax=Ananas comosus TaxID=4615 RepID=A0A199VA61_ANACO|nr:Butyrate--CoA ligase AAE11, peroxisomal [Ananas comosus]